MQFLWKNQMKVLYAQRKKNTVKATVLSYKLPGRTGKSVFQVFPGKSPGNFKQNSDGIYIYIYKFI